MRDRILDYIWAYNACDETAPRSAWRHFLQIMILVGRDLMGGTITLHAMGLVYTTLLSLVPLLAVSISVLKGFGVHDQLEPALAGILSHLGERGPEVSARIVGFVDNMKFGVLGALGLAMLLYTVISLIQKIETAFNSAWRLHGSRGLMQRFSDYLSVIMVGPVLIFAAVGITASLGSSHVVEVLNGLPYMNDMLRLLGKLLPFMLVIAAFTFIYLLVPNTRVKIRSALYGAVIAGLLWETSGILFTSFVGGSTKYTAIYSGFAILLVFMIWLYLSWIILLVGASISFYHQNPEYLVWQRRDIRLSTRQREQMALQAMLDIGRAHNRQSDLRPSLENLARHQQIPSALLLRVMDGLQVSGLVKLSADDPPLYLPGCALQSMRLAEIVQSARSFGNQDGSDALCGEQRVGELLDDLEAQVDSFLGERTLADFIQSSEEQGGDENSLV
ncbi:MAG: YhjD/YihY/BrkB family envelope integrity protein [Gammaproteobacteria bacterium]|jgi:membrane protein